MLGNVVIEILSRQRWMKHPHMHRIGTVILESELGSCGHLVLALEAFSAWVWCHVRAVMVDVILESAHLLG